MGYTSYDTNSRSVRASSLNYHSASVDQLFQQNVSRSIHESLDPKNLRVRECLDSTEHPNSLAVIFQLDVTGSMGKIPHDLIKDGLPTMMGKITEVGSPDAALCFVAAGDHLRDQAPFQVGQFESGDEELDRHLQNTWLEGEGGGNGGESYALGWYFAAKHTKIDCFDKRGQKGIFISVGDENVHKNYAASALKRIFGTHASVEGDLTASDLLAEAQQRWHVYHIALPGYHSMGYWGELLGNNLIEISNYKDVPKTVAEIVLRHTNRSNSVFVPQTETKADTPAAQSGDSQIML